MTPLWPEVELQPPEYLSCLGPTRGETEAQRMQLLNSTQLLLGGLSGSRVLPLRLPGQTQCPAGNPSGKAACPGETPSQRPPLASACSECVIYGGDLLLRCHFSFFTF